jgi:serine/threonine protein kinase
MLESVKNIDLQIPGLNVKRKIGEGGMSVVYLAEQLSLKREVAIKVLKLEVAGNELDVQRFKQEAKTIAHLHHPNIIDIYDIGQTKNGEVYFTMPYLNHGNFSTYQIGDEKEFIKLLKSICDGLAFAHNRGVIHRDIKPDNLIFDAFGNVKIADFGIAITKKGVRMTKEHQIVGSAQYMSPEQARSLKVDLHSDIYSLGIVIYERLTGKVPFDAEEGIAILVNHVSVPPPKLPSRVKHWQWLIDKCLAKKPSERFQSMYELKAALDKVPINSIQKTHQEIHHALTSKYKYYWMTAAVLFISLVFIIMLKSKDQPPPLITAVTVHPTVVKKSPKLNDPETGFSEIRVNNKPLLTEKKTKSISNNSLENEGKTTDAALLFEQNNLIKKLDPLVDNESETSNLMEQIFAHSQIKYNTNTVANHLNIQELLSAGFANIEEYKLIRPSNDNAMDKFNQVLAQDPDNLEAKKGLDSIARTYYLLIISNIQKNDYEKTLTHTESLMSFLDQNELNQSEVKNYKNSILTLINEKEFSVDSIRSTDLTFVTSVVKLVDQTAPLLTQLDQIQNKQMQIQKAKDYLDTQALKTIRVSENLAFTTTEISKAQYSKFVKATNRESSRCKHEGGNVNSFFSTKDWEKPHFDQEQNHPVVCVSWQDAQAYAVWLSQQAGMTFRLAKKSEWLLIAGISNNPFIPCKTANVSAQESIKIRNKDDKYDCDDQYMFTSPVALFAANKLGLFDVQGNVSEWLLNCESSSCDDAIAIGSSWYDGKNLNELNKEQYLKTSYGYSYVGFRLVQEL